MTATDLLPCPFCGCETVEDWSESTWSRPVKWMYCAECNANGPRVMLPRNEQNEDWMGRAIAAWNTRTPDPAVREARIEGLEAANRELGMLSIADLEQAQEAWEAQKAAEAALAASEARVAKLLEALEACEAWIVDGGHVNDDDARNNGTGARRVYEHARAAIKEAKK